MNKFRRVIQRSFAFGIIIGILFLHFYAPRFITEVHNPLLQFVKNTESNLPLFTDDYPNGKSVQFKSFDEIELNAFITYSEKDSTKGTVILLHGIRAQKEHFKELSEKLATEGFNAVAIDLRAHGESEGKHCTFGVKEKKDISALIDCLIGKEKLHNNIGVWGQSLGGAVGLQAMGTDNRIKFGIIESTFSDFRTITHDYVNYHAGFNLKLITNYLVTRAGEIADFPPKEANPKLFCASITQPILLVHGNKDQRINIKYAKENFNDIKSKEKQLIVIKEANHLNVWKIGGQDYLNTTFSFLNNHSY